MRQSERAWRLHEVLIRVDRLAKDMPTILGAIADHRHNNERLPVSTGGISDPTSTSASSAVDLLHNIDTAIKVLHAQAEKLERIRTNIIGQHTPPPVTDEHGRLIRDNTGRPIEYCELHQLVGSNEVATRWIPNPDESGTKIKVCRWCGRYHDDTGTAPTTQQVAARASGQRVKRSS